MNLKFYHTFMVWEGNKWLRENLDFISISNSKYLYSYTEIKLSYIVL